MNNVILTVAGKIYQNWKTVSITRAIDAIAGAFSLSLSGESNISILPDQACQLSIDGDPVITGSIDNVDISVSASDHQVSISGRDKTKDLVDCSVISCPSEFKDQPLHTIVEKIASPYGIQVESESGLFIRVEKFAIQPGERAFEAIDRLCGANAVLPSSTPDGNIRLTRSGRTYATTDLVWGKNLITASAQYRAGDRYRDYKVLGHRPGTDNSTAEADASIVGRASDPSVSRPRTLTIMASGITTNELAARRAAWEAAVRAGRSASVDVTLQGWRQDNGDLWWPNLLVDVMIPALRIEYHTMIIGEVQFTRNLTEGTMTRLTLKRADAYLPEPLPTKPTKVKADPWASVRAATGSTL